MSQLTWNISANSAELSAEHFNSTETSLTHLDEIVLDFFAVFMSIVAIVGCVLNFMILVLFTKFVHCLLLLRVLFKSVCL